MSELNERDLERVSGGLTEQQQEDAIERVYRHIVAKDCGGCQRADKSDCRASLKHVIRVAISGSIGPTTCPMKR